MVHLQPVPSSRFCTGDVSRVGKREAASNWNTAHGCRHQCARRPSQATARSGDGCRARSRRLGCLRWQSPRASRSCGPSICHQPNEWDDIHRTVRLMADCEEFSQVDPPARRVLRIHVTADFAAVHDAGANCSLKNGSIIRSGKSERGSERSRKGSVCVCVCVRLCVCAFVRLWGQDSEAPQKAISSRGYRPGGRRRSGPGSAGTDTASQSSSPRRRLRPTGCSPTARRQASRRPRR